MHKHNKLMYNFVFPLLYIKPPTACLYLTSGFFSLFLSFFLSHQPAKGPSSSFVSASEFKVSAFFRKSPLIHWTGRNVYEHSHQNSHVSNSPDHETKSHCIPLCFFLLLSRLINIPTARLLHRSPRGKEKKRTRFLVKLQ